MSVPGHTCGQLDPIGSWDSPAHGGNSAPDKVSDPWHCCGQGSFVVLLSCGFFGVWQHLSLYTFNAGSTSPYSDDNPRRAELPQGEPKTFLGKVLFLVHRILDIPVCLKEPFLLQKYPLSYTLSSQGQISLQRKRVRVTVTYQ